MPLFTNVRTSWDVVFCVDGTGSMEAPWDNIKRCITELHTHLAGNEYMFRAWENSITLRIKIIIFRDYYIDKVPMEESEFFTMPDDMDAFNAFWDRQETKYCGGDIPENGLEALYYAMRSDFTVPIDRDHRCYESIVLITDAEAHPLQEQIHLPNYPQDMVDEDTFADMWNNCREHPELKLRHGRSISLFVPHASFLRVYDSFADKLEKVHVHHIEPETLQTISPEEFAQFVLDDFDNSYHRGQF